MCVLLYFISYFADEKDPAEMRPDCPKIPFWIGANQVRYMLFPVKMLSGILFIFSSFWM